MENAKMDLELTPWQICKKAVNNMAADYDGLIRKMLKEHPNWVVKDNQDRGTRVNVYFPKIQGYEIELEVHYHKEKGVSMARYYAWNEPKSISYVRDLLQVNDIVDFFKN